MPLSDRTSVDIGSLPPSNTGPDMSILPSSNIVAENHDPNAQGHIPACMQVLSGRKIILSDGARPADQIRPGLGKL